MKLLPIAVTVGFSGPCRWFSEEDYPNFDPAIFQEAATKWLVERLKSLPQELGLADHHFISGLSQIAVGGDHAFTQACQELGIPQRIAIPQPSDVFLDAQGSSGPDFSEAEKKNANDLLASKHIIEEKVVSSAATREGRFEEANIELVRHSDVIIAMLKPVGGKWTRDLIPRAKRWNTPVLVVNVSISNGLPHFEASWHGIEFPSSSHFVAPRLPNVLAETPFTSPTEIPPHAIPSKNEYFNAIKNHCSSEARKLNKYFDESAKAIIGRHFYATVCAVFALVLLKDYCIKGAFYPILAVLLCTELLFLVLGYRRHKQLHHQHAAANWAMNRLLSEVARSAIEFRQYHTGFAHLWMLNLPDECRPLLRTMEILQLRETRLQSCATWQDCRASYLAARLTGESSDPAIKEIIKSPQISYYAKESQAANQAYHRAHQVFTIASISAMVATSLKFIVVVVVCVNSHFHPELFKSVLGFFGVLLPVVAVASLSYAAAKDLEARSHTFKEMHDFLKIQATRISEAKSEREFSNLLKETESRLLGETVTWYSRRTFTGIA